MSQTPESTIDRRSRTLSVSGTELALRLDRQYGHFRLDASTTATISGLEGYWPARFVRITATGGDVTLAHEDSGADAEHRLALPGGRDLVLADGDTVTLFYDAAAGSGTGRWRLLERDTRRSEGTSFPSSPADYQRHFHDDYHTWWTHDPGLGKWVGPPERRAFGKRGTISGTTTFDAAGYTGLGGSGRGHPLTDVDWRLLDLMAHWDNSATGSFELRRKNVDLGITVAFTNTTIASSRNLATTFSADGVLQARSVLSSGSQFQPMVTVGVAPLEAVS